MSSRQIQIRRGTSEQHENFTGALGEVTMDTTNKTLRIHDGETAGGVALAKQEDLDTADYVIEYQTPTAENDYTWYRKYKSGWVEQGGTWYEWEPLNATKGKTVTKTLPITMAGTDYTAQISLNSIGGSYAGISFAIVRDTTSVNLAIWNFQSSGNYTSSGYITWFVSGVSAE